MESEKVEIFNPRDWPFGKLSINQHFEIISGDKRWSSVTNYIYSALLSQQVNRDILSNMNVRNIPEQFKLFSQNEYRDLMINILEKAFEEVLKQKPEIREMLLQTAGTRLIEFNIVYRSNNTLLGKNSDDEGDNIYGVTLKSVLHRFLTNKQLAKENADKEEMDNKIFNIYLLYKYLTEQAKSNCKILDQYSQLSLEQMFEKAGGIASLRSNSGINKDVILEMYYGDVSEEEREQRHEEREEARRLSYEKPKGIFSIIGGLFARQEESESTKKFEKIPYVKHKVKESLPQIRLFVKDPSFIVPYIKKEVFKKLRSVKEFQIRSGALDIYTDYTLDTLYNLSSESNSKKLFAIERRMELKKEERKEYTEERKKAAALAKESNIDPNEQIKIVREGFKWFSDKDLDRIISEEWEELSPEKYEEYRYMSTMELNMKARNQAFGKLTPYDKSKLENKLYDLYKDGKLPASVTKNIDDLVRKTEANMPSEEDIQEADTFDFTTFDDVEVPKTEEEYNKKIIDIYPEDSEFVPTDQKKFLVMSPAKILGISFQGKIYPSICHILAVQAMAKILTPKNTADSELAQKFQICRPGHDKTVLCFGEANAYKKILINPDDKSRKPNNFITPDDCNALYTQTRKKYTKALKIQKMKEGIDIVYENLGMAHLLLLTGNKDIVFTDRSDSELGIGNDNEKGDNMVGKYLMEVRDTIRPPMSVETIKLDSNEINAMLSDPFFKGWIEMKVRDTCQLLQIMQQYLYDTTGINDQYKPRFVEYVQDYMFQSCFSMYSAADLVSVPPPAMVKRMLTIKVEEPESQVLIWNRIAVQIQYLSEYTSNLTPQNLKKIILGCEEAVTNSPKPVLLTLPNPDQIIAAAIVNLVKAVSLFNNKFNLSTKITNLEVDVACAIILNKPILSKKRKSETTTILDLDEIEVLGIENVIARLKEIEANNRHEWYANLPERDRERLLDHFSNDNIELLELLTDQEEDIYDASGDDYDRDDYEDEERDQEFGNYDEFEDDDDFDTLIPPSPEALYTYILEFVNQKAFEIDPDIQLPTGQETDSNPVEIFTYYVYRGIDYIKKNPGYKSITKNRLNFFAHMNMRT